MPSRRKASLFLSSGTGQAGGLLTMSPSSPPLRAAHVHLGGLPNLSIQKHWQNVESKKGDLGSVSFKNSDDF